jgi:hypothetical protein
VHEEQADVWILRDVPERVEHAVSGVVRERERALVVNPDEAWWPTSMGRVRSVFGVCRPDEEEAC